MLIGQHPSPVIINSDWLLPWFMTHVETERSTVSSTTLALDTALSKGTIKKFGVTYRWIKRLQCNEIQRPHTAYSNEKEERDGNDQKC